jgi:serine phosphatase RsbU (regulator of sigma subunit)
MFGLERVDSLMSNCSRSTDEIVSGLVEGVRHFSAPAPPEDDLTLVLVDVR